MNDSQKRSNEYNFIAFAILITSRLIKLATS